ncbi:HEPN/Toprim-associated domain-containing protein [Motilimonas cestriensis]|uniref:HEPN/Toprim-associated domain-containing protein n=1 Tax=Motilimonas cestriensis TaxID=2742685 RepID=UPI003DA1D5D2
MGSYADLSLGKLEVAWSKNEFLLSHSELFQENCLLSSPYDDSVNEAEKEWYELKLELVKDRLELLGYTLEYAKKQFENPSPFSDEDPLSISFEEVLKILKTVDVSKVTNEFSEEAKPGEFAPQHVQELIKSSRNLDFAFDHWDLSALLENFCPYSQLRVLAESPLNLELPVVWNFDEVVKNGWVERDAITHGVTNKFLIVTEGTSDSRILRKAIDLLRPHINDLFYFVDMEGGYPFTGTGNLFNFVKGLGSINIQNDVLVIFDNDVEGVQAMNRCLELELPRNMRIMKLPDLDEFNSFPTIGPNSEAKSNINSKAAAIECYLDIGRDAKIRWTNYREDTQCYHGSLIAKDKCKKEFLKQNEIVSGYDYRKLERILDSIILECTAIANKALHRTSR